MNKIYTFMVVVLLSSCGSSYEKIDKIDVPDPIVLSHVSRHVDVDMLLPTKVHVQGDKLIVLDQVSDGIFKVFDIASMEYLYSFGKVGRAYNEFVMPIGNDDIVSTKPFEVCCAGEIKSIEFGDTCGRITRIERFPTKRGAQPINRPRRIDDSTYFSDNMFSVDQRHEYAMINLNTKEESFFSSLPRWCAENLDDINKVRIYMKDSRYNAFQRRLAAFYYLYPVMKIMDVAADSVVAQKRVPLDGFSASDSDREKIYFTEPYITNNYIYVMWANTTKTVATESGSDFRPHIYMFDWEGNIINNFELDYPVIAFAVSEADDKIFGTAINDEDVNNIYEFAIPKKTAYNGKFTRHDNPFYSVEIPSSFSTVDYIDLNKTLDTRRKGEIWHVNCLVEYDQQDYDCGTLEIDLRESTDPEKDVVPDGSDSECIIASQKFRIGDREVTQIITESEVQSTRSSTGKVTLYDSRYTFRVGRVLVCISLTSEKDNLAPYSSMMYHMVKTFELKRSLI